ncbi:MAG: ABC transporter permease [Thermodesulfobacteriota bacterium]
MKAAAILPKISYRFQWVWYRNLVVWSKFYKSSLVANIVEPLIYLFGFGYGLGQFITNLNGMSYVQFIAPGLVSISAMNSATFECTYGAYARMTVQKTFDAMISTPVNIDEVVTGEILFATTKAFGASIIMISIMALFGLVPSWTAVLVPLVMLLTGFVFASAAILYTSFSHSWDFFSYYFTLVIAPLSLLSGAFFPLERLPGWVTQLVWFTPLFHSVELSRGLVMGEMHWKMLEHALWLILFACGVFLFAVYRIRNRVIV